MNEKENKPELGTCCACGGTKDVRNIICLNQKSPQKGTGWGCVQCNLPADGAVAVICDACHEAEALIRFACLGYPARGERIPIEELTGTHDHDMRYHRAEAAAFN